MGTGSQSHNGYFLVAVVVVVVFPQRFTSGQGLEKETERRKQGWNEREKR